MHLLDIDPSPRPVSQTVAFVCVGRRCSVQLHPEPVGLRLLNAPNIGVPPNLEIALGEKFGVDGVSGRYRVVRQTGQADALMLDRVE